MRAHVIPSETVSGLPGTFYCRCLLFLLVLLTGCATSPDPATHFTPISVIAQPLYTFAIYSDEARLISNPLLDLRRAASTPLTNAKCTNATITDVYVFVHGWNFTLQEAIANSHGYLEVMDQHLPTSIHDKPFCPFSIFVIWPSVSRPLGDIATAVLPFGLDRGVGPLTNFLDRTIFFLPSAWKESLQSFTVALGRKEPDSYFNKYRDDYGPEDPRRPSCEPLDGEDLYGVDTEMGRMGRDCPVSTLLFNLLKLNERDHRSMLKIHIVGHSYGAKLSTLATVEALRRWEEETAQSPTKEENLSSETAATPPHKQLCETQPIESLVLFNAAFNPREIIYHTHQYGLRPLEHRVFPTEYLQCIPRKALVYSRRDHATGGIFNLSQIIMDNRYNTYLHASGNWASETSWSTDNIPGQFSALVGGSVGLLTSFLFGPATWTYNTVVQLPGDVIWHVRTNDSIIRRAPEDGWGWAIGRGAMNTLDFFLPFSHLRVFGSEFPEAADKLGLFRSTMPALGNTGVDKLYAGRNWAAQHTGDDWIDLIDQAQHSTDQNHDSFCRLAAKPDPDTASPLIPGNSLNAEWLYSFDGRYVLNTLGSFSGAHGDLRQKEQVVLPAPCGNPLRIQKREAIHNFVLNFTKRGR